jgi:hypothetical protein
MVNIKYIDYFLTELKIFGCHEIARAIFEINYGPNLVCDTYEGSTIAFSFSAEWYRIRSQATHVGSPNLTRPGH